MTQDLKQCPFCGREAKWFKTGRDIGIECGDGFDCPGRAQTNVYAPEHRQTVIDQWNRRVVDEEKEMADEVRALCAAPEEPDLRGQTIIDQCARISELENLLIDAAKYAAPAPGATIPREPSNAMLEAACRDDCGWGPATRIMYSRAWKRMYDAAVPRTPSERRPT